jgi:hypothetical protein
MFVCCVCCVLSGRGLCDELITRPEESYRLWHVVVGDQETSCNEAIARVGLQSHTEREREREICLVVFTAETSLFVLIQFCVSGM